MGGNFRLCCSLLVVAVGCGVMVDGFLPELEGLRLLGERAPGGAAGSIKLKQALGKVESGAGSKFLRGLFGCDNCPYRGSDLCPHGIKDGERHSNGVCGFRLKELKALVDATGKTVPLFQRDHIVKAYLILEKMREEYVETGILPKEYHQLERNFINLIDKFRKQNEGTTLNVENGVHDEIRKVIEMQEKVMSGKVKDVKVFEQQKQAESGSFTSEDS